MDFFALDTNGCQGHVRRSHPRLATELKGFVQELESDLAASRANESSMAHALQSAREKLAERDVHITSLVAQVCGAVCLYIHGRTVVA